MLGVFELSGLPAAPRGTLQIEVTCAGTAALAGEEHASPHTNQRTCTRADLRPYGPARGAWVRAVQVVFDLDANGILNVSAEEKR